MKVHTTNTIGTAGQLTMALLRRIGARPRHPQNTVATELAKLRKGKGVARNA